MSDRILENNSLVKNGESVFYGVFERYIFRNEKNGNSYFQINTRQTLLLEQQYRRKFVKTDPETKEDVTWYTIACDGSKMNVPYYDKKTPVRVTGYFLSEHDSGYGWDFRISSIQEASVEETTTIEYLTSLGFPYEGAVNVVKNHGADIFDFIQKPNAAKKLVEETKMPLDVVESILTAIKSSIVERKLFEFLSPLGISYPTCIKAVKFYSVNAEKRIRKSPYEIGQKLGLNFKQCDRIAKACAFSAMNGSRIRMAALETLKKMGDSGHTWSRQEEFYKSLRYIMHTDSYQDNVPISAITPAISECIGSDVSDSIVSIYNRKLRAAEKRIAKNLKRLILAGQASKEPFSEDLIGYAQGLCGMTYGTQQRQAFPTLLSQRGVKILTGGPGTGKTTTTKGVLLAYKKMHPDHKIKLCATSGRAAQRLSESTEMPATTVHRLLEYRPFGDSLVHKDAMDPIDADVILVDEVSMMDTELFDILLQATKSSTMLILVGDIHQLESVGPGAILHDLLGVQDSLIQKCMLTEVFRQKGGSPIIENAMRINEGKTTLETCEDFQIIHTKNEEESLAEVTRLMKDLYNPLDPFETQILCPARTGDAGIDNLNKVLQKELNPAKKGLSYGSVRYHVHDKIIMMKNNYDMECNYWNGDIGVVTSIDSKGLVVKIRDQELQIKRENLDEMRLSYGMTIHKSQGSEFGNIIVVMPMNPSNMLVRNLLYTAVTRAKKRVFIINEGSALEIAIKTDRSSERRTMLADYLTDI